MIKHIFLVLFSLFLTVFANDRPLQEQLFMQALPANDYSVALDASTESEIDPPEIQSVPQKSRGKAMLFSLILPGLGEKYAGAHTRAAFFMSTEVALILSYIGFKQYSHWRKEDYKTYAASHAGVDLSNKTDSYFVNIGNYTSISEYNAAKLRQRNLQEFYRDEQAYYWEWQSQAHRHKFDQLRISADKANSNALFVLGAIFANHMISAIDAMWSAQQYNKNQQKSLSVNMYWGEVGQDQGMNLALIKHF
jgi:hypothetical protein